ncbi:probable sodium/metabolite cotransporter BASS4, chloroplastic isoform X2 [Brachypodium distachyon]|uniref:probable sodium/metabolite cotransporter BASS4, chloroplastic isoform X2 n=1 Tax=Brachypodium distachyon TaxID=15368 RepID=UPI000D0DC3BB|nr:probable sodium/metabolite cotransporter BASS4, chloroplastic isoform X2 [Brachypodium distachyon]|eukprot:XP_024317004.1 probable sodium/metabolite cotransporter BASS4, chloroplastic isoform X2 [Brachypodium distachyon]
MVTHHPSLLRAPFPTGLRHRTSHAFLLTAAAHSPPPPPLRLRSLRAAAGEASPVVDDGGKRATPPSLGAKVLDFARSNFLPLALTGGVAFGLLDPTLGCLAHKCSLSKYSTFGIFLISGLTLHTKELGAALEAWPAGLFGLGSILLFTPFLAQFIVQIQFFPHEFITGLAMFCCMPTTLSSGVTLTQLVGGNSALALAMTVLSNLLGIMFVPVSLAKYIGAGAGVSLPSEKLFKSLVNTLLIPLILGKVARETSKDIAEFVDGNRKSFSVISAVLLSLVPWIQVSRSRSLLLSIQAKAFATTVTIGVLLHLALLAFNATALQVLSCFKQKEESVFARKDYARAVILVASQQTLMFGSQATSLRELSHDVRGELETEERVGCNLIAPAWSRTRDLLALIS